MTQPASVIGRRRVWIGRFILAEVVINAGIGVINIGGQQASISTTDVSAPKTYRPERPEPIKELTRRPRPHTYRTHGGEPITISANVGVINLFGQQATVIPGAVSISSAPGIILVSGQQATVSTTDVPAPKPIHPERPEPVKETTRRPRPFLYRTHGGEPVSISANVGIINIGGQQATVSTTDVAVFTVISPDRPVSPVAITRRPAPYLRRALGVAGVTVNANLGVIGVSGQQATVTPGAVAISALIGIISISGQQAAVTASDVKQFSLLQAGRREIGEQSAYRPAPYIFRARGGQSVTIVAKIGVIQLTGPQAAVMAVIVGDATATGSIKGPSSSGAVEGSLDSASMVGSGDSASIEGPQDVAVVVGPGDTGIILGDGL